MKFIGKVMAHDLLRVNHRKPRKDWFIRACGEPTRLWESIPESERSKAANEIPERATASPYDCGGAALKEYPGE